MWEVIQIFAVFLVGGPSIVFSKREIFEVYPACTARGELNTCGFFHFCRWAPPSSELGCPEYLRFLGVFAACLRCVFCRLQSHADARSFVCSCSVCAPKNRPQ